MHAVNKSDSVQKMSPSGVKQAAYGETRTANIKKKLMKNKFQVEAATPANAVQQSSNRAERVAVKHNANRELPTQKVLALLKRELPSQYEFADCALLWCLRTWLGLWRWSWRLGLRVGSFHLGQGKLVRRGGGQTRICCQ